jgi:hypothetical protein
MPVINGAEVITSIRRYSRKMFFLVLRFCCTGSRDSNSRPNPIAGIIHPFSIFSASSYTKLIGGYKEAPPHLSIVEQGVGENKRESSLEINMEDIE